MHTTTKEQRLIEALVSEYFEDVELSDLSDKSVEIYTRCVEFFVRWLKGDYKPGQGVK